MKLYVLFRVFWSPYEGKKEFLIGNKVISELLIPLGILLEYSKDHFPLSMHLVLHFQAPGTSF